MSHIIKKNRWQIAGITLPAFFLLLLWAVGVSVYPGWVRPLYGVVGATCDTANPAAACDLCLGEFCGVDTVNGGATRCAAANGSFATPSPSPRCPSTGDTPCERTCIENGPDSFDCLPDHAFCEEVSGGTEANECRTATCSVPFDPSHFLATGCEYASDPDASAECVLCESPFPTGAPEPCGNGSCEPGLGENADNCSLDCRVPGFEGPILEAGDPTLDLACAATLVSFDGPPFNVPGTGFCEDGAVCTDNVCNAGTQACDITPKSCSLDVSDLCCPSACTPPSAGTCGNNAGCDVDCYVPVDCSVQVPTPTPTPNLEGSGACSLGMAAASPSAWLWFAGISSLWIGYGVRRRV